MPDHPKGYVHRQRGLRPSNADMADAYRRNKHEHAAEFTLAVQKLMITEARNAGKHINATVHAVSTEPTHVHVLLSWSHKRTWKSMRSSIRRAMTTALNKGFGKRTWFSDAPSRKRARDQAHFDYLILHYLPKHSGAKWFREEDVKAARARAQ